MATWVNLMDIFYPVGAFYFSTKNTSPSSLIGGTWAQVSNAVIRGVTSGAANYTSTNDRVLTAADLPAHLHGVYVDWDGDDAGTVLHDVLPGTRWKANWRIQSTAAQSPTGQSEWRFSTIPHAFECFIWYRTA